MAYTILNNDGTTLLLLTDSTVDQSATSLNLVGKNVANYGQYLNNNLVWLLENFANSTNNPPRSPVTGQLWYDTTAGKLNVYDGVFKSVSGATVASVQPNLLSSGDLWWDSTNNQLSVFNLENTYLIGPIFPKSVGSAGWTMPSDTVHSTSSTVAQEVILLENYGIPIGALSNAEFELSPADSKTFLNVASTTTVAAGLTISGSIKATKQITSNYLSAYVDIGKLGLAGNQFDVSILAGYTAQNIAIISILNSMFPVSENTATQDVGVPLGASARVVCGFTLPTDRSSLHQVRRFTVVNQPGVGISWQPTEIYANTSGSYSYVLGKSGLINILPIA